MQAKNELLEAALDYARAGVPVFPLRPNEKVPLTANGFKDETTDEATIRAWWDAEPRANIGFRPQTARWSVVDPDGEEGLANWRKLQETYGFAPETYTVRTPGGGLHLYFQGDLPPSQSALADHIDTRGGGSYVLIPPSIVNGKPYTVEVDVDPAPLPAWISERVAASKRHKAADAPADIILDTPEAIARATDFLKRQPPAIQGQMGDKQTFVTAATLADLGISEETALELMLELFNPRCEPEWEQEELESKISSAYRNRENAVGAFSNPRPLEEGFASYASEPTGDPQAGAELRFRGYSPAEMRKRPPLKWLMPGFVAEKGLGLIYGPGGGYKTFLAVTKAADVARAGHRVLWLAGEGSTDVTPRLDAYRMLHGIEEELPFTIFEDIPLASLPEEVEQFRLDAKKQGFAADLIVLDTLATFMGGLNENDSRDAGLAIRAMKKLRDDFDAAVVAIHHTGKDTGKGTRGSSAIPYGVDHAFEVVADTKAHTAQLWTRRHRSFAIPDAPENFEARELNGTLVFQSLSIEGYKELMGDPDIMSPAKVQAVLVGKGIRDGKVLTSQSLAFELRPKHPDEDDEEHMRAVGRVAAALTKAAKGNLQLLAVWDERSHTQGWTLK